MEDNNLSQDNNEIYSKKISNQESNQNVSKINLNIIFDYISVFVILKIVH